MGGLRTAGAFVLATLCVAASPSVAAARWSAPVRIVSARDAPHDIRALWTADDKLVALANINRGRAFASYAAPGGGAFSRVGRLAPYLDSTEYVVAALPQGGVLAVYAEEDGLFAATLGSDGRLGSTERLFPSGHAVYGLRATASPRGDVLVAWATASCDKGCDPHPPVQAAFRPAGSDHFDPPAQLSAPGTGGDTPFVAIDPAGNALVAWLSVAHDRAHLNYALRPEGRGFGAPVAVGAGSDILGYDIAASATGRIAAVWSQYGRGPAELTQGTIAQGLGVPMRLGPARARNPRVALDGARGAVMWTTGTSRHRVLRLAPLEGAPRTIARGPIRAPKLSVQRDGRRLVTWRESGKGENSLHAALVSPSGSARVQTLDREHLADTYVLAGTTDGSFAVAWEVRRPSAYVVKATAARPGHDFARPVRLGGSRAFWATGPALAVGRGGRALAYWGETGHFSDADLFRGSFLTP